MSSRFVRPARFSAAAVVVLASMSAVSSSDDGATVAARTGDEVVVAHRDTRFAPVQPQWVESPTTLVSERDRHRKVRVDSPRGSRVWTASELASHDLPQAALTAYRNAAATLARTDPGCDLPWTLLAAIGRVESDHGRYGGAVLASDGVARPAILGVPLNGKGPVAAIADTDGGSLDGDTTWDRAVGPMQFIPSTWAWAGRDGDGDGRLDPHDLDDAALAAGDYLCTATSLSQDAAMDAAIFRYNPSDEYVALVRAFEAGYATGVFVLPSPGAPAHADGAHRDRDKKKHRADKGKDRADRPSGSGGGHDNGDKGGKGGSDPTPSPKPKPKPGPSPTPDPAPTQPAPQPSEPQPATQPSQPSGPSQPTTEPSPSPSPDPTPTAPALQLNALTGPVTACDGGWCADGRPLDLGPGARLTATAAHDYDGDGTFESNAAELDGLVGRTVTFQVEAGTAPAVVYLIAGDRYRLDRDNFA